MDITLEALPINDAESLFEFELENRVFLRKWFLHEEMIIITLRFSKAGIRLY